MDTQRFSFSKIQTYQSVGFVAVIALTWLDELIALPSLIIGDHPFIVDFRQTALKMLLVLVVWLLVVGSTRRLLLRVRYLEGFMRICAWCHHIDLHGEWVSMEEFMRRGFDTPTTHGICPVCLSKQKAEIARMRQRKASSEHPSGDQTSSPA
jgi:hypothetical protein